MAYSDKVWKNAPDYTTPLSAAGLNDWEARIKSETDALEVLAEGTAAAIAELAASKVTGGVVTEGTLAPVASKKLLVLLTAGGDFSDFEVVSV